MAKKRMHRGLVALSTAAIATVYAAGYLHTQGADASIALAETAGAVAATPRPSPTIGPMPFVSRAPEDRRERAFGGRGDVPFSRTAPSPSQPVAPLAPPTSGGAAATAATYKDGTYSGTGQSRRGGVEVSVTVQGGRVASVKITRSSLQYPLSYISGLPGQVVARQGAQVDVVSGATYSTMAFRTAVQQALAQAQQ